MPVIMRARRAKSSITNLKGIYYMIKVTLAIMIASISRKRGKRR